ncbi:hypothetical protein [Methanofollis liminatans]|jgi:hypothetical protein|uniref:hypothetical protein n=1 Tax=Methanofollis liminatans TaxID=2201 RepID=UPI00064F7F08|nr:hypothetical protein [Methanofollis liminatans]
MNPAPLTTETRCPTVKIIFTLDTVQMMRKYQMTPDLLRRPMHPAAGEEIDPDIKTFFPQNKFDLIGEPGILNSQRKLEELHLDQVPSDGVDGLKQRILMLEP